jgi:MFS family permease
MVPTSGATLISAFPVQERGRAMAAYAGISHIFLAAGPLIGGALTEAVSWRAVFWLNVPVGVAALVLVAIARPEQVRSPGRISGSALVLLVGGLGATVLAVNFSPVQTGVAVLAMILPITVAAQLGGRWFDRSGVRPPVLTGLAVSTLGMLTWTLALPHLSYPLQVPGMVLTGFGLGLTISPTNTDALSRVGAVQRSQASGVLQTLRQLGGTLGVAVVGAVVLGFEQAGTQAADPQAAADAVTAGFAISTAAFAIALLVAVWLLARDRVTADPEAVAEAAG